MGKILSFECILYCKENQQVAYVVVCSRV